MHQFSETTIRQFAKLYQQYYGVSLTREESIVRFGALVDLIQVVRGRKRNAPAGRHNNVAPAYVNKTL